MKKSILISFLFTLLFVLNVNAQQGDKKPNKPVIYTPVKKLQPQKTDTIRNILGGEEYSSKEVKEGSYGGQVSGYGGGSGDGTGTGTGGEIRYGEGFGHVNYELNGRKPEFRPAPQYKCNEEGTVVVEILVDKTGKVIEVKPGARGTTNTALCLVDLARKSALETKFDASLTAPERQVGRITYNFRFRE